MDLLYIVLKGENKYVVVVVVVGLIDTRNTVCYHASPSMIYHSKARN